MRCWEWSYERMKAWIQVHLNDPTYLTSDNVTVVWTFGKVNGLKKYQHMNKVGPLTNFMFRNLQTSRFCPELSNKYDTEAPHGIYLIPYFKPNWSIVVIPKTYEDHPFVFGNHFSFPYELDKKKIAVHYTAYIPLGNRSINPSSFGSVIRRFRDLPNPCSFPPSPDTLDFDEHRGLLVDFLSYAKGISPSAAKKKLAGGSVSTITKTTQQQPSWDTYDVSLGDKALDNWNEAHFEDLCIIGIRAADGFDFTITQYDSWGPVGPSWVRPALFIPSVPVSEAHPQYLFPKIKKWLERGSGFLTTDPAILDAKYPV